MNPFAIDYQIAIFCRLNCAVKHSMCRVVLELVAHVLNRAAMVDRHQFDIWSSCQNARHAAADSAKTVQTDADFWRFFWAISEKLNI